MRCVRVGVILGIAIFAAALPAARGQEAHGAPAAEHAQAEHKPEKDMTVWKWANFAILVGVLGYLIAKNAGPFFAARTAEIQKGIEEARRIGAEAAARASAIERRMSALDSEIASMRAQATAEAEAEGLRIREETERDLARIRANGQREIESAAKSARESLRLHAADLALGLARERIARQMTPAGQSDLVDAFVRNLPGKN
jgi:F-type H+-transporting ATPase subunit b